MDAFPEILLLDFDGVIVDSMEGKLDAYAFALSPYGFSRSAIRALQRQRAGISRRITLPFMAKALGGWEMSPDELEQALERFRIVDERNREDLRLMPGAAEFISALRSRFKGKCFVVTGTPQEVIEATVKHKKWEALFDGVYGSPPGKAEHLRHILDLCGKQPLQACFVGDSPRDQDAARETGVPFVAFEVEEDGQAGDQVSTDRFVSDGLRGRIRRLDDLWNLWL